MQEEQEEEHRSGELGEHFAELDASSAGFRNWKPFFDDDYAVPQHGYQKERHRNFPAELRDLGLVADEAVGQHSAKDQTARPTGVQNVEIMSFLFGKERRDKRID